MNMAINRVKNTIISSSCALKHAFMRLLLHNNSHMLLFVLSISFSYYLHRSHHIIFIFYGCYIYYCMNLLASVLQKYHYHILIVMSDQNNNISAMTITITSQ